MRWQIAQQVIFFCQLPHSEVQALKQLIQILLMFLHHILHILCFAVFNSLLPLFFGVCSMNSFSVTHIFFKLVDFLLPCCDQDLLFFNKHKAVSLLLSRLHKIQQQQNTYIVTNNEPRCSWFSTSFSLHLNKSEMFNNSLPHWTVYHSHSLITTHIIQWHTMWYNSQILSLQQPITFFNDTHDLTIYHISWQCITWYNQPAYIPQQNTTWLSYSSQGNLKYSKTDYHTLQYTTILNILPHSA